MKKWLIVFGLVFFSIISLVQAQPQIINGQKAELTDWPWIAVIYNNYYWDKKNFYQNCTAQLVDAEYILTAAHCYRKEMQKLYIVVGRVNLDNKNQGVKTDSFVAKKSVNLFFHPRSNQKTANYDVLLIKLPAPVEGIEPVQLAQSLPPNGAKVNVAGFGKINLSYRKPIFAKALQEATAFYRKPAFCKNGPYRLHKSMICIKQKNTDTCYGDSGGPLIYKGRLIGANSFGVPGCKLGSKNWFANVPLIKPWIEKVISKAQ